MTDNGSAIDTPAGYTLPAGLRNVRLSDPITKRRRLSRRPGLALAQSLVLPGPVQELRTVTRARTEVGLVIDVCENVTQGRARTGAAPSGNIFRREPSGGVVEQAFLNVVASGGPSNHPTVTLGVNTARTMTAVASNYTDTVSGFVETAIQLYNELLEPVWDNPLVIASGSADRFTNTLTLTGRWIFATVNENVVVIDQADGSIVQTFDCNGWSNEAVDCAVLPDGRLAVLMFGAGFNTTLASGVPVVGGAHFRSGVMLCNVADSGPTVLTQAIWGGRLTTGDTFFEADHGYFRISEHAQGAPRGCRPHAIAVSPVDGSIYVCRTNQGWGPNGNYQPDGTTGYVSVMGINPNGTRKFEIDTLSLRLAYTGWWGTYYNDIGNHTLRAAVVHPERDELYVAGRRNVASPATAGTNVYRIRTSDGAVLAQKNLSGTIAQAAIAVDPIDGSILCAGERNDDWDGSGGTIEADVWRLDPITLRVLRSYDWNTSSIDASGVGVLAGGDLVTTGGKL